MFCMEQTIIASSHFGQVAAPVKCKRWGCPNCQEWRQRCLMARCIEGKPNRFLTITCRAGQFGSKAENARAISKAFAEVVRRWKRKTTYNQCQYIAVFEPHASGWPHLHVLWKGHWLAQSWLSEQMKELLGSPIVHVSRIKNSKQAAFYVAKYFSKEPEKFGTSKRYWTSQKWPKLVGIDAGRAFHKGFPIDLVNKTIQSVLETWQRYHRQIWTQPPIIYGWGVLYDPHPENTSPKPSPWRKLFTDREPSRRAARAPMGRGRGACA